MSYRDPYYSHRYHYDDDYYYQTIPIRRRSTQYQSAQPRMKRSLSTGTLTTNFDYNNGDPYDYFQQETYDKNQYYEHVPDDYEELDGEPMTELEKLAAENALYNQACSKVIYRDNQIPHPQSSPQHQDPILPSSFIIKDNSENDSPSESSLTPTSSSITLVDNNVNNSSTATNKSDPAAPFQKKKLWTFSSLFKKAQAVSPPIASPRLFKTPTQSLSTPYKNVISPSSTASSSPVINNSNNINPKTKITNNTNNNNNNENTVWAFRVPVHHVNSTIWRKFDDSNQQKLNQHVGSNNFNELDMFDSHIGSGKVPIVVYPLQRVCYYPADLSMQSFICLEIKPIASHVYHHHS